MKKEITTREQVIALLVFILWSIGVVFFPNVSLGGEATVELVVFAFYMTLHVAIFVLAVLQLGSIAKSLVKSKWKVSKSVGFRTALYTYVLIALLVSFILSLQTFFAQ